MFLLMAAIPGRLVLAKNNATDYVPRSGPRYYEYPDGSRYWDGFIAAEDENGTYNIFKYGNVYMEREGAVYDLASNTLTLTNFKYPKCNIYMYDMGDDFVLKIIGNCEINTLEVNGTAYTGEQGEPQYWGGSLNLEGSGSLTILNADADDDNPWGFIMWAEGSEAFLKISEHVSLKVTAYKSEAAIMIFRSAGFSSDEAITVGGKPLHQVYPKYTVKGFEDEAEPTLKDYWVTASEVIISGDGIADIDNAPVVIAEQYLEYTGSALAPKIVSVDGLTLKEGTDYTVTYSPASPVNVGKYTAYLHGKGKYTGTAKTAFEIFPASVSEASVSGITAKSYTGKGITQTPVVRVGSRKLKEGTDYTLSYKNNVKVGTATVTITGKGNYCDSISKTFAITKGAQKAKNTLDVKGKTATIKYSKLKKKNQTLKVSKVIKTTDKGQGTVTYKKKSGNKKITINKKSGKITVKKGLKKGMYKLKIKVTAAGNAKYESATKAVTIKVEVK